MNSDWKYYGVFFDEKTKEILFDKTKNRVIIKNDWKLYADHMTIIYNDGDISKEIFAEKLNSIIGECQTLKIDSIGISEEAIAFGVSNYKTQNKHSHITIAVAPNSEPVRSNYIENWSPIEEFYVDGVIDKR
ncbi:MAG: hypothetical protein J6T59_04450 [Bacteroidales bacterium]|nr:hypothetical protein [Bacteroidales bacterium]